MYHATIWPELILLPEPHELLAYLDRDYGLTPSSTDDELSNALIAAGHRLTTDHSVAVANAHRVRRYEHETGNLF